MTQFREKSNNANAVLDGFTQDCVLRNESKMLVFYSYLHQTYATTFIGSLIFCFRCRGESEDCEECGDYVRLVFPLVSISLAAVSMLIVLLFQFSNTACKQSGEFHFSSWLKNTWISGMLIQWFLSFQRIFSCSLSRPR